jgi:uncharacterized protein YbaR (Trm112 family)
VQRRRQKSAPVEKEREESLSYESLLEILRCPACASLPLPDPGKLDLIADKWFVCQDCERKYPVRNRIPVMLVEEGDRYRDTPIEELGEP